MLVDRWGYPCRSTPRAGLSSRLAAFTVRVFVDDVEVASISVDQSAMVDLLPIMDDGLGKLRDTNSIRVVMDLRDGPVMIFEYRPQRQGSD